MSRFSECLCIFRETKNTKKRNDGEIFLEDIKRFRKTGGFLPRREVKQATDDEFTTAISTFIPLFKENKDNADVLKDFFNVTKNWIKNHEQNFVLTHPRVAQREDLKRKGRAKGPGFSFV